MKDFNRAFQFFRNVFVCIEYYKGNDHAHLLIKTNRYLSVFDFLGRWKCYLHFRKVRETKQDVERVKRYIQKHMVRGGTDMEVGNVKVWVKKKEDGKVVLTIQAPKWYDLSRNRMVITWTVDEFKQFLGYLVRETGITKAKVVKPKRKGKNSSFKVVKGFDKAVKG